MAKTITVKGVGRASAKPDYVVLSLTLETTHTDYQTAMGMAAKMIHNVNDTLAAIGFEKGSAKTTNFNVSTNYDRVKDCFGNYESVFRGYMVTHYLKLSFAFDMGRLAQTLSAISGSLSHPQLTIAFTVKDSAKIKEEMLQAAASNAKRTAEVLCNSSGVRLGSLTAIDYNWGELDIYSNTRFACCEDAMVPMIQAPTLDIDPEDINISDTATFVWEIE